MVDALKDSFGPDVPERIGAMLAAADPTFDVATFLARVLEGYDDLELTPRARRIADVLATMLPASFDDAARLVRASLGPPIEGDELVGVGMAPFVYLPYVYWVGARGVEHWDTAMDLQHELTQRFSCEFSIRAFIEAEPDRTLARLRGWTRDPSPHVRRLVSEGTRPRLPWAPTLRRFVDDPTPVLDLLERLKDDPTTLVRRSVANNLNDIGKDHPQLLADVCSRWLVGSSPERHALVRHALRSALRRGDPAALAVLGYGDPPSIRISDVVIEPAVASIGGRVRIAFLVTNRAPTPASWRADLRVHFVKASGRSSPKTFTLATAHLEPGASTSLSKSVSLEQHSTRSHHPGEHALELVVNGRSFALGAFTLVER